MEEEFHNHMRIPWHDYTRKSIGRPITEASLSEKASIIGRTGIMLLSCGTGAWRVRSSMNTLARELGITCTADIGLLSIEYTCICLLYTSKENPLKGEYFIPSVASDLLHDGKASLEVLVSKDQWYGVTYPEDKQSVIDALAALRENGTYKF